MLTDAGPLVALLDRDDLSHQSCTAAAKRLPPAPLVTTWRCFTEAMYLLGKVGGLRYQSALWQMRTAGRLVLHDLSPAEADRMAALMEKYRDTLTPTFMCIAWLTARRWKWCADA